MKTAVREMWSLEYEVDELQSKFSESIGTLDLDNLDVDFIEDMMLKAKPLQSVLNDIRVRQNSKLAEVSKLSQSRPDITLELSALSSDIVYRCTHVLCTQPYTILNTES